MEPEILSRSKLTKLETKVTDSSLENNDLEHDVVRATIKVEEDTLSTVKTKIKCNLCVIIFF